MIDLSQYKNLQTNLFVKVMTPFGDEFFSDYHKPFTFNGDTYNGLGMLLNISSTEDNLRASPNKIEISISGIPENFIIDVLASKLKGSEIAVYRAFFDSVTGELLNILENPAGKFRGIINNFSIQDDLAMGDETGTISLILECTSYFELLENKIAGRRTNPIDQQLYAPGDLSMDRVPSLARSNFDFGAPK